MITSRLRLVPLVLALGLLAGMIPGASAEDSAARRTASRIETYSIKTIVSLKYKTNKADFVGYVSIVDGGLSEDEFGCVDIGRSVKLFKNVSGKLNKMGSTKSDAAGFYKFDFRKAQKGKWEAKVAPMTFADRYGDLVECSGARASLRI